MPFISRDRLAELEQVESRYEGVRENADRRYTAIYHLAEMFGLWDNYPYSDVNDIVDDILLVQEADETASNLEESKNRLTPKKTKKKEGK